ncbi:hypothetical protein QJS10_CPA09g01850 [Acorus calamus]|uniref:Uncharacterized protein n=1 Tax=Acorus calamus TaxID=4465 RepID=A0AAV9E4I3_ACOCL|nr:hypothetical protein QJS10_CPA09g01850 [Acorus calamus]
MKGVRDVQIRKNTSQSQLLRRLKEYLLYTRLKSLVSPPHTYKMDHESSSTSCTVNDAISIECEPRPSEVPRRDSDEEITSSSLGVGGDHEEEVDKSDYGDVDDKWEFVPSIKLKRMDNSLIINTVVLKEVSLTSKLFKLLEEEELDIVFANEYRTESKVVHTIQVNSYSEVDVDAFEEKLCLWAGKKYIRQDSHT